MVTAIHVGERSRLAKAKGLEGASEAWSDSIDAQTRVILGPPVKTLLTNFVRRAKELAGEGDVIVELPRRGANPLFIDDEENRREIFTTKKAVDMIEKVSRSVVDFKLEIGGVLSDTYVQFAEAGQDAEAAAGKEYDTAQADVRGFNKKASRIEHNSIHQARALKGRLEGCATAILGVDSNSELMEVVELLRDDIEGNTNALAKRLVRNVTI